MSIIEALQSAQFVVDKSGHRTAVLLEIGAWEALIAWIENITDEKIAAQALTELEEAGGRPKSAGWLDWDEIRSMSTLDQLWQTILDRKARMPEGSYTAHLLREGENEILKKIGEEAVEVIIAAKGEGDERVLYESADLLYHLMTLLAARDLTWSQLEQELASRFG